MELRHWQCLLLAIDISNTCRGRTYLMEYMSKHHYPRRLIEYCRSDGMAIWMPYLDATCRGLAVRNLRALGSGIRHLSLTLGKIALIRSDLRC